MKDYSESKIPRLFERMEERKITGAMLSRRFNFSQSTITEWRKGRSSPSSATLSAIADYLCTSSDYLLGKTDEKETTPTPTRDERERQLLESFSRLDDKDKAAVLAVVESMNQRKTQDSQVPHPKDAE